MRPLSGLGQQYCSQCSDDTCFSMCVPNSPTQSNPLVPFDISNLPLQSTAPILPGVSAIPCQTGQTCSYLANVPDWVIYAGVMAIVLVPLFLTRAR